MSEKLSKAKVEEFLHAGVPPGKKEVIKWDSEIARLGVAIAFVRRSLVVLFLSCRRRPRGAVAET